MHCYCCNPPMRPSGEDQILSIQEYDMAQSIGYELHSELLYDPNQTSSLVFCSPSPPINTDAVASFSLSADPANSPLPSLSYPLLSSASSSGSESPPPITPRPITLDLLRYDQTLSHIQYPDFPNVSAFAIDDSFTLAAMDPLLIASTPLPELIIANLGHARMSTSAENQAFEPIIDNPSSEPTFAWESSEPLYDDLSQHIPEVYGNSNVCGGPTVDHDQPSAAINSFTSFFSSSAETNCMTGFLGTTHSTASNVETTLTSSVYALYPSHPLVHHRLETRRERRVSPYGVTFSQISNATVQYENLRAPSFDDGRASVPPYYQQTDLSSFCPPPPPRETETAINNIFNLADNRRGHCSGINPVEQELRPDPTQVQRSTRLYAHVKGKAGDVQSPLQICTETVSVPPDGIEEQGPSTQTNTKNGRQGERNDLPKGEKPPLGPRVGRGWRGDTKGFRIEPENSTNKKEGVRTVPKKPTMRKKNMLAYESQHRLTNLSTLTSPRP